MIELVSQVLMYWDEIKKFLGGGGMAEVYLAQDDLSKIARASFEPDDTLDNVGF